MGDQLVLAEDQYFEEIYRYLEKDEASKEELAKLKTRLCRELKVKDVPTDIEVCLKAPPHLRNKLKKLLLTKPTRTISGVSPVAVMTAPFACPHGRCTMCPGGPDSFFGDVPQSYTGAEPATMRGMRANYDPYIQVMNRLEQYIVTGHNPDKVDVIVMGGTFLSTPKEYQESFILGVFKAMNDFSDMFYEEKQLNLDAFKDFFELPGSVGDPERTKSIHKKLLENKAKNTLNLEEEKSRNETAVIRCIGLTLETKPDWGLLEHGNEALRFGGTRIELGVQTTQEAPLKRTHRGHTLQHTIESIATLKDLGFKLNFHIMPGLPGVSKEQDIENFKELFSNPAYCPDMIKIYPCMVMPGTPLQKEFERGTFTPLTTEESAEIISEMKRFIPTYCRVMRVQRDIPTKQAVGGVDMNNIRQYILKKAEEKGIKCRCIRCREVGRAKNFDINNVEITVKEYDASDGKEFFIAAEDTVNDVIVGFVRLRFPAKSLRDEITESSAMIRELHVYGTAVAIGRAPTTEKGQHRGWGKKLMAKAEEIAKENNKDKMLVISGVGVRGYYYKLGYGPDGPYVSKKL